MKYAMEIAAVNDHMHIVEWFHENGDGCTEDTEDTEDTMDMIA